MGPELRRGQTGIRHCDFFPLPGPIGHRQHPNVVENQIRSAATADDQNSPIVQFHLRLPIPGQRPRKRNVRREPIFGNKIENPNNIAGSGSVGSAENDHPVPKNRRAMSGQMRRIREIILRPDFLHRIVDVKFVEKHRRLVNRIRTGLRPSAEQN